MAMNETYTCVFCDLTITKRTKGGETITTKSANLYSGNDLYISQVMTFFSNLKMIGKLLHTAVNKGYDIRLYFGRYKHENGFLMNELCGNLRMTVAIGRKVNVQLKLLNDRHDLRIVP